MSAPLPSATLSAEQREQLEVRDPAEVGELLEALARHRAPLTVHAGDGRLYIASCLLAAHPAHDEIVFDCSADEQANEHLARSAHLHCVAELHGVRLQFTCDSAERTVYENFPALRAPWPGSLLRLQRREDFRIALPIATPLVVRLPHPRARGRSLALRVIDLSSGGIAVADAEPRVPLESGQILDACRLALPDLQEFAFRAQVTHVSAAASGGAARCGLRFLDLDGSTRAHIQRAVLRLQRERR